MTISISVEEYRATHGKISVGKYRAKKSVVDGITFDSTMEGNRYAELSVLQKTGIISKLRIQVPYKIIINDELICTYKADFVYFENGIEIVEDAKGYRTKDYILKKKLMKAVLNIDIKEFTTKGPKKCPKKHPKKKV